MVSKDGYARSFLLANERSQIAGGVMPGAGAGHRRLASCHGRAARSRGLQYRPARNNCWRPKMSPTRDRSGYPLDPDSYPRPYAHRFVARSPPRTPPRPAPLRPWEWSCLGRLGDPLGRAGLEGPSSRSSRQEDHLRVPPFPDGASRRSGGCGPKLFETEGFHAVRATRAAEPNRGGFVLLPRR